MEVVPALTQGEQSHKTIVAACITGVERLTADQVSDRIDTGNTMKKQGRAEAIGAQPFEAAKLPRQPSKDQRGKHVQSIDQAQNRIGL